MASCDLIPARNILQPRDEAHAIRLLRELGVRVEGDELAGLARRILSGAVVVVRRDEELELDDVDDVIEAAPLLSMLAVAR